MRGIIGLAIVLTACGGAGGDPPGGKTPSSPTDTDDTTSDTTTDTSTDCTTDEEQFLRDLSPVLQSDCIGCHVEGGLAGDSRNVLVPDTDPDHVATNRAVLEPLALEELDGTSLLLLKALGEAGHTGGARMSLVDPEYGALEEFVARVHLPGGCDDPGDGPEACAPGEVDPGTAPLRRLTDLQVQNAAEDLFGVRPTDGVFPPTELGEHYRTWSVANPVGAAGVEGVMLAAEEVAAGVAADVRTHTGCDPSDATCLETWRDDVAYKTWRHPLTVEEQDLVTLVWESDTDPAEQVRRHVAFLLQAPQFLYLGLTAGDELDVDLDHFDDHVVASRLSFFLLDTTPSDELLALAAAGQMHTRAQVLAQANQLVLDHRALPVVAQFHQDWLHTYQLDTIAKDTDVYPQFGPALVDELKGELDLFTTEVVFSGNGTFDDLLYSRTTWTTPELDAIYGTTSEREGDGWERRELGPERPGVLGRAGFLTAHAYSTTSSPVRRGVFVIEQMLCQELEAPDDVPLDLEEPTDTTTIRDRLAAHAADPACRACHDVIDPVGFSMENFGALGEWRDDWENGIPVDATGTLADPVAGDFDGMSEMLAVIDHGDLIRDCYVEHWFQYAVGRPAELADTCALETLGDRFAFTGGDLRDLLAQLAATDAMRIRRKEAE